MSISPRIKNEVEDDEIILDYKLILNVNDEDHCV